MDSLPTQFQLPRLLDAVSAFELKTNPHHEAAEKAMYAWFDSYNVYRGAKRDEYLAQEYGLLCAWVYPETQSQAHLETCIALNLWLFAYDDMADESDLDQEGAKLSADISIQVLRDPDGPEPKFRFARMLKDIYKRIRSNANESCCRRFSAACEQYTQASVSQTMYRIDGGLPTVDEFIILRRDTSAVKLLFAFVEYAMDLNIPDAVHDEMRLASVVEAAMDICAWNNDLCSFNNEQSHGDTQNIVYCALVENNLTLQEAIDFVASMVQTRIEEFQTLKRALASYDPDTDVLLYIKGLEYWISGSIHWFYHSKRYFKVRPGRDGDIVDLYPRKKEHATLSADNVEDFAASD
ncbi:isoprenoid synthase domain-containing protein [Mycena rebaudengoi]|nr:isoprenoid synthase domain-containing protein [Mycena rebaudengoi]